MTPATATATTPTLEPTPAAITTEELIRVLERTLTSGSDNALLALSRRVRAHLAEAAEVAHGDRAVARLARRARHLDLVLRALDL